jgi:hypothetical protein
MTRFIASCAMTWASPSCSLSMTCALSWHQRADYRAGLRARSPKATPADIQGTSRDRSYRRSGAASGLNPAATRPELSDVSNRLKDLSHANAEVTDLHTYYGNIHALKGISINC